MEKNKFQYLRAFSAIVVLSFVGSLALTVLAPVVTHNDESASLQTHERAKTLGKTISQKFTQPLSKTDGRMPASSELPEPEGFIGVDEQGQPYHYSVLQTDAGVARVVIRSGGPKGQIQYVEEGGQEAPLPEEP